MRPLSGIRVPSPFGDIAVVQRGDVVVRMTFLAATTLPELEAELKSQSPLSWSDGTGSEVRDQLEQYLSGQRKDFDVRLEASGTPFQTRVWSELRRISFGETISYAELARRVGDPGASRAVGRANNRNPIPIVIPCHRVIGSDGALVGFGGGLEIKRRLLDFERGQASLF